MCIQKINVDKNIVILYSLCVHKKKERGVVMAKTGRPKSDNPKKLQLHFRVTKEEMDTISYVAEAMGVSMSEAVIQTMEERANEIWKIKDEKRQD